MKNRIAIRAAGLLLPAVLAVAGCSGCGGGTDGGYREDKPSGVIVYARGADSKKLDPADITDGESVKVCTNLFETLVTFAESSADIVPLLAASWTASGDGLEWTFKLRPGVKFHDGSEFDSAAVEFCMKRLVDPGNPYRFKGAFSYSENYTGIAKVEAAGPLDVVFTLKEPSATFLPNLAMFPASMQSPQAVVKHGEKYFKNPCGTGPYRFVSWQENEKIVLEAFDGYWGRKAATARIIFKPVPDNSARRLELERGEVDIIDGINFSDIAALRKHEGVEVQVDPGMNFGYLALNTLKPPFDKVEVREAIALAVDKEKIRSLAFHGFGDLGPNPMPPTVFGYNSSIKDRIRDTAAAKALLRKAGVAEGFEVRLFAMPNPRPYMPQPRKVAQVLKENLKEVGIEAVIESPEWQLYLDQTMNGKHDLCLLGWTTDNGDPDNFLWQLLDSSNAKIGSAMNVSFYRNAEVDALFAAAKRSMDRVERKALYEKAQEIVFRDVPMIALAYFPQVVACRKGLTGYAQHPTGIVRLWNARIGG